MIGSIPNIRVESLFKLVVDLLEVTSSMKGQVGLSFITFFGALLRLLGTAYKIMLFVEV